MKPASVSAGEEPPAGEKTLPDGLPPSRENSSAGKKALRIGVWNTAFLGDAVLTIPLLRVLGVVFPEAAIDLYVRQGLGCLFTARPELTTVYEYAKRGAQKGFLPLIRLARQVRARRYDIWINAHPSPRSAVVALASGAPRRIGYTGSLARRLCHNVLVDRRFGKIEEIERLLELVRPLLPPGFNPADHFQDLAPTSQTESDPPPLAAPWPDPQLPPPAEGSWPWRVASLPSPRLGMHPGSIWPSKRWTPEGFAEVARRAAQAGAQVILLAGPGEEQKLAEKIVRLSGLGGHPNFTDLSGRISLLELAQILGRLDLFLGNDSGPMHLAWAQRTPVTTLFGPTVPPLGFVPRGPGDTVLGIPLDCRPCGLHGHLRCPLGHHHCMTRLSADLVWADVARKLQLVVP